MRENSFPGDELQAVCLKVMEDGKSGLKNTKTCSNGPFFAIEEKREKKAKTKRPCLD